MNNKPKANKTQTGQQFERAQTRSRVATIEESNEAGEERELEETNDLESDQQSHVHSDDEDDQIKQESEDEQISTLPNLYDSSDSDSTLLSTQEVEEYDSDSSSESDEISLNPHI